MRVMNEIFRSLKGFGVALLAAGALACPQGAGAVGLNMHLHGLPVYASTPGRVYYTGYKEGLGQIVDIDFGHGRATRYEHLSRVLVHAGQSVTEHQLIGRVSDTGWNMWPRLVVETGDDAGQ